ncbi:MAG: cation transporter, partial [Clostridia bacterium]
MTAWLVRKLIRNADQVEDIEVRAAYGTLASCTGVVVNLLLAAAKFIMGLLSGSLAITADAANNLSDAAGSVVTLISVR